MLFLHRHLFYKPNNCNCNCNCNWCWKSDKIHKMTFTSTRYSPSLIVWAFPNSWHTAFCIWLYIQQNSQYGCVMFSIYATCEAATHCKVNRSEQSAHIQMFQILWQFSAHVSWYQHNRLLTATGNIKALEPFFYIDMKDVKKWNKNNKCFKTFTVIRSSKDRRLIITIKFHSSQCSLPLSLIHVYTNVALRQVLMNHVALL